MAHWQKKTENGGFCSFVNARVNLANERCALSSSQTPRVSVTWRAHHQRRARHRPRSPPPSQPPPHVRARERASERAPPPPPPLHARGSSSSCCRRRVVLWVAWVPWVLQRGWGVMHGGVALTSAPRSRAHVRCAAWRRTQQQMSERANAARAHG